MTANTIKIITLIFIFNFGLFAQLDTTSIQDTAKISSDVFIMQKSPWGAVARSAILPGWGQIYNEAYWKVPVVWGIMGWFAYSWIDNNNKYKDYQNLYSQFGGNGSINYKLYRDF